MKKEKTQLELARSASERGDTLGLRKILEEEGIEFFAEDSPQANVIRLEREFLRRKSRKKLRYTNMGLIPLLFLVNGINSLSLYTDHLMRGKPSGAEGLPIDFFLIMGVISIAFGFAFFIYYAKGTELDLIVERLQRRIELLEKQLSKTDKAE